MKTIWKYAIVGYEEDIKIPCNAKILRVKKLPNQPVAIWCLVDTSNPIITSTFKVYATGETIPDNPGKYIGTFDVKETLHTLVYHLFQIDQDEN